MGTSLRMFERTYDRDWAASRMREGQAVYNELVGGPAAAPPSPASPPAPTTASRELQLFVLPGAMPPLPLPARVAPAGAAAAAANAGNALALVPRAADASGSALAGGARWDPADAPALVSRLRAEHALKRVSQGALGCDRAAAPRTLNSRCAACSRRRHAPLRRAGGGAGGSGGGPKRGRGLTWAPRPPPFTATEVADIPRTGPALRAAMDAAWPGMTCHSSNLNWMTGRLLNG
jgi:hypothetical protein